MIKKRTKIIGKENVVGSKVAGIILIILAFLIAFVAVPALNKVTNKSAQIIICKADLKKGDVVQESDIFKEERGTHNLKGYFTNKEDVVGKIIAKDMDKGDVILENKIGHENLKRLDIAMKEKHSLISVTMKSAASGVSSHLKAKDKVRLYYIKEDEFGEKIVIQDPRLEKIEVYGVENSEAKEALREEGSEKDADGSELIATTLTLIAKSKEEEKALLEAEYSGSVHAVLVER